MKSLFSIVLIVVFSVSCTKSAPKLDSGMPLQYSFKQPQRKALPGMQSGQLGRPDKQSLHKQPNTYYSANGNICRRLSNSKTVCYIGGKWHETVPIIGTSRK